MKLKVAQTFIQVAQELPISHAQVNRMKRDSLIQRVQDWKIPGSFVIQHACNISEKKTITLAHTHMCVCQAKK